MKKRNIEIKCRLNRKEIDKLNKCVKKSGLSREGYIRHLINSLVPCDVPPPDYYAMMRELRAIDTDLGQIAQQARASNVIDSKRYENCISELNTAVVKIVNAVMLPRKV